jgi:hypothetical protein
MIGYFDGEARPTRAQDGQCNYASVLAQPASGNYYEDAYDGGGLVMSKRLNCPDQPRTAGLHWATPSFPLAPAFHYAMFAGADGNLMGDGYDTWTIPNDGIANHCTTPPEIPPRRTPLRRAANYAMDRLVLAGEPFNDCPDGDSPASLEVYYYAQSVFGHLPHQYNGDQAGNFMLMDGHVETFTYTYFKNWADKRYPGTPGNGTNSYGPGYPFAP